SPLTAREHVRVARRLRDLPVIAKAFGRGELSYSQVRALTRIEDVEREDELLGLARAHSAGQLERLVRAYRSCSTIDDDERRAYEQRSLTWYSDDDDGSVVINARLSAEQGALVI